MNIINLIITGYVILFCLGWCVFCVQVLRNIISAPLFEKLHPSFPDSWPTLSIVISACNEAESIKQAVSTLLKQDYPDYEIILVNDRSTDETEKIINEIAKKDTRIKPVHIKELPPQWLGKTHAFHIATQRAAGEWILYTDADVHFKQGTLKKAIALALEKKVEHIALLPKPATNSFWLEVLIRTFGLTFLHITKAHNINKPGSNAYIGVGAFNMVKKDALAKTKGFEWLRMEVGDDLGLGLMLHNAGIKTYFALAFNYITLVWYPSIKKMIQGLEKEGAFFSFTNMVFMCLIVWLSVCAPLVAILCFKISYLWVFGVFAFLSLLLCAIAGNIKFKDTILPSLCIPIGQIILSVILLRSTFLCKLRGGIIWRGTLYKTEDLKSFQRLKFDTSSFL